MKRKFWYYHRKKKFLSDYELQLFYNLMINYFVNKNGGRYYVLSQVRIADLIYIPWYKLKFYWSVDFLICDFENDMKPLLAIELNWGEHSKNLKRRIADYRKKKLFKRAWIPLVYVWNEELKDLKFLVKKLRTQFVIETNMSEYNNDRFKTKKGES